MVTSCLWLIYIAKKEFYFSKLFIVQYYTDIIVTDLFILGIYELVLSKIYFFRSTLQFALGLGAWVLDAVSWRLSSFLSKRKGYSEKNYLYAET